MADKKDKGDSKKPEKADRAPKPDKGGVLATYGLSTEQGQEIIMAARQAAGWFADEEA